jgi:hypothetical protein
MFMRYFENIAFMSSMARAFAAVKVSTSITCPAIAEIVSSISFCLVSRVEILSAPFSEYPCHTIPTASVLLNF